MAVKHTIAVLVLWTHLLVTVDALYRFYPTFLEGENDIEKPSLPHVAMNVPAYAMEAHYYSVYSGIFTSETISSRRKEPSHGNTCSTIRDVPKELRDRYRMAPRGIAWHFEKYTEAYSIPVVGSRHVSDKALQRACYVLRFLLADRLDVRLSYYKRYGYVAVLAQNETLTSLPTYNFLSDDSRFASVRGLGAVPYAPASSAGEENILCLTDDPSGHEDMLVRELAAGILHLAVPWAESAQFLVDLQNAYQQAIDNGRWTHTYASQSATAYFAEGVQSYFNVNGYADPPDGLHNRINTRVKLRSYDPELFQLVHDIFPCANHFIKRCHSRGNEDYQLLQENCNINSWHWPPRRRNHRRKEKR